MAKETQGKTTNKVRFISSEEQRDPNHNLPYYQEYLAEDLPFPRELTCCHLWTVIFEGKRYCLHCGEEAL